MTQLSGSVVVEVDLDRVADLVAARVVAELHAAARDATGGSTDPGPGGFPVGDPNRVQPGGGEHYERTGE